MRLESKNFHSSYILLCLYTPKNTFVYLSRHLWFSRCHLKWILRASLGHRTQRHHARRTDPVHFQVIFTRVYFSVCKIRSLEAISDSSLSSANSKQAIRIIQLHHGSYFLFPSTSSTTGWQPMPNADFCKGNY